MLYWIEAYIACLDVNNVNNQGIYLIDELEPIVLLGRMLYKPVKDDLSPFQK